MLFKIAFRNVRRQIGNYLIYFITVSFTVALIFAINNFVFGDLMEELKQTMFRGLQSVFTIVVAFICVVIAFVLGYATSFLLRRRKKEFGLYLTLGMTRGNILTIFAGETAVTFLLSLGAGILLGLAFYQGLMAVFINFLEMEYTLSGYSAAGTFLTIGLVIGMFLISSAASLLYLRFAKITRLLRGDKTAERNVRHPVIGMTVWALVSLLALGALILSVSMLGDLLQSPDLYRRIGELTWVILLFSASVVLLPAGVAKTVVPLVMRARRLTARGTGVFTCRQLAGRLNANAVMAGVLSFLLAVSVIGPNVFLTQNTMIDADVARNYAFDFTASDTGGLDGVFDPTAFDKKLEKLGEYAEIDQTCIYTVYCDRFPELNGSGGWSDGGYGGDYVKESDFVRLCAMKNVDPPALEGGYLSCSPVSATADFDFVPGRLSQIRLGGVSYTGIGTMRCPRSFLNDAYVVPDEALETQDVEISFVRCVVTLKNPRYDARGLDKEWRREDENGNLYRDYTLKEYERLNRLDGVALFLLGDLFISVVFILLVMAMLALKMLSMLAEDKQRFRTLWQLGASEGMLRRSLFSQMFFFYFLPFVLPLALCFPLSSFLYFGVAESGLEAAISSGAVAAQVACFAGILLAVYALYFVVTWLIAWFDVKKTLRSVG